MNVKTKKKILKKKYLFWYELMLLMRKFEEKCAQLYIQQKIRGFCHLYSGQEAVVAGSITAMQKDDNMITAYRDHVHPIAKGMHPKFVMAELYGKITGSSKGKGGSMHIFDKKNRFFGGHAIVGAHIPLAAGIAFADKYRNEKRITVCFLGDGAVHQGALHETFNMAKLWKLPVIYVIENNQYAMGTSVERASSIKELYKVACTYNIKSSQADGMSCEEMHNAMSNAIDYTRKGNGPYLLEAKTYRYRGHSMSDPATYRSKEEVEKYKQSDPIHRILDIIYKKKFANENDIEKINIKVKKIIEQSVKFAEESPFPNSDEIYKDVYAQKDYPFIVD